MTQEEIKKSGLLELYAMGALNDDERQVVETALEKYKDLRKELSEIEKSLLQYAQIHSVEPGPDVRQNIQQQLSSNSSGTDSNNKSDSSGKSSGWNFLFLAMTLASVAGLIFMFSRYQNLEDQFASLEQQCDSLEVEKSNQIAFYESVFNPGNRSIRINATEKYPESELVIYLNDNNQRGFIQPLNLPELADNESFQLWSLKGSDAPTPLDVFDTTTFDSTIFEIQYIDNPDAYAITIEPKGGSTSPTLENLIGVFPLS
ncbi:MAG: anti-sigma factor [Saprospiraceae bacterium]|nr:anti-sigma factor [Saprospiraceae bacterium]